MNTDAEVVVIGGINVDIKSRVDASLVMATSNPGTTTITAGGVGRNVAESLARLGVRTSLISAVGDDAFATVAIKRTADAGVDLRGVLELKDTPTGTYTAVIGTTGELAVGVASMQALRSITPAVIRTHHALIRSARWLVLDANLEPEVLVCALDLAAHHRVAVAIDPVSVPKSERVRAMLHASHPIALLTPNRDELAHLVERNSINDADLDSACRTLHAQGVQTVWVHLGMAGSLVSSATGAATRRVATTAVDDVVDVTGAGDAALAGWLWASLGGHEAVACARFGTAAALCTLRARASVDPHLSASSITALERTIPEST